jgi:NADH:ubiquinone oxidoreductase subunit C
MDRAALLEQIQGRFPGTGESGFTDSKWATLDVLSVKIAPDQAGEFASFAREVLGLDLLNMATAVDWPKENRLELVYHFTRSSDPCLQLFVKCDLSREGEPSVPSMAGVYAAADWQEREIYDLFGVRFAGHPDLRRILLWEGYPGWPLRKDYVHTPDKYDNGSEIGLPALTPSPGPSAHPLPQGERESPGPKLS